MSCNTRAEIPDAPFYIWIYKDGTNEADQRRMTIPFVLEFKEDYCYWIFKIIRQVRVLLGIYARQFILNYLQNEETAVEALKELTEQEQTRVINNVKGVAERVVTSGVRPRVILKYTNEQDGLGILTEIHDLFTVYEFMDYLSLFLKGFIN